MLSIILSACVLAAVTMWMHAAGIAVLLRGMMKSHALAPTGVWIIIRTLLRMIWWLLLIHLAEISVWGRSICGADACPKLKRRATFPEPLTPPLAMGMWCWPNRGDSSDRSRA